MRAVVIVSNIEYFEGAATALKKRTFSNSRTIQNRLQIEKLELPTSQVCDVINRDVDLKSLVKRSNTTSRFNRHQSRLRDDSEREKREHQYEKQQTAEADLLQRLLGKCLTMEHLRSPIPHVFLSPLDCDLFDPVRNYFGN